MELDIKITAGDLYDFMLMHSYNQPSGILGSCFGALMIVVGVLKSYVIFIIGGVALLLYLPWTLFIKSRQQALNPVFKEKLHYTLTDEGITISQNGNTETQSWDNMVKAVSTGRSIIVYTSKTGATIFPKAQMGDDKAAVISLISTNMPASKVKIRG